MCGRFREDDFAVNRACINLGHGECCLSTTYTKIQTPKTPHNVLHLNIRGLKSIVLVHRVCFRLY